MELTLLRYNHEAGCGGILLIDGQFFCHTLEPDNHIQTGRFEIKLRTENSPMNTQYATKFSDHQGMLWLQNVFGRTYIYIHIGNRKKHSDGCILVGASAMKKGGEQFIGNSTDTYKRLYDQIIEAIDDGDDVFITVTNIA